MVKCRILGTRLQITSVRLEVVKFFKVGNARFIQSRIRITATLFRSTKTTEYRMVMDTFNLAVAYSARLDGSGF